MGRFSLACSMILVSLAGCADPTNVGFGPFPSSSLAGGQLTAGVAGFIPGTVPTEGEFTLLIVNTDNRVTYNVQVTPLGRLGITRTVAPCSMGTVAVPCDAATVLIEIVLPGQAVFPSLVITPDPAACAQRLVYISVPVRDDNDNGTGGNGDDDTPPEPPTLTETLPPSAVNCGLGNLPSTVP